MKVYCTYLENIGRSCGYGKRSGTFRQNAFSIQHEPPFTTTKVSRTVAVYMKQIVNNADGKLVFWTFKFDGMTGQKQTFMTKTCSFRRVGACLNTRMFAYIINMLIFSAVCGQVS